VVPIPIFPEEGPRAIIFVVTFTSIYGIPLTLLTLKILPVVISETVNRFEFEVDPKTCKGAVGFVVPMPRLPEEALNTNLPLDM
jgi:hypothetical protein